MESSEDSQSTQPLPAMVYPTFEEHTIRPDTPPPPFIAHGSDTPEVVAPERQNSFCAEDIEKQFVKKKTKCMRNGSMNKLLIFSGLFLMGIVVGIITCYTVLQHRKEDVVVPPQSEKVEVHLPEPEPPMAEKARQPSQQESGSSSWVRFCASDSD